MIKCKGHRTGTMEGDDFECEYAHGDIDCGDCIINGGRLSPQTGKTFRGNSAKYVALAQKQLLAEVQGRSQR
mgnify:CR=1 FL=1